LEIFIQNIISLLKYNPENPLLFSSGFFLWWFTIILFGYVLIQNTKTIKIVYLIVVSYYFYYKSGGIYFYLLFISTFVDFFIGKWLYKSENKTIRVLYLLLSLFINFGILAYFKYFNLFINTFNTLTGSGLESLDIFLPVGISFYTFQTLSYTIDIFRKKLVPTNNFLDFSFFVSFFPQLVAGPIVRASEFLPQIRKPTFISKEDLGKAVFLISVGLFKKAVISDYISINFVDRVFDQPLLYSGLENLMALYGYAVQIYCDFSGYSDMAIGLALLMGFKLPVNFNAPYKSASVSEFWRRWHISLSSWLKDYLYISLGGNRKGKLRTYLNLLITMLLGGLWHGASWKFVIWGGLHGVALALEKLFSGFITIKRNIFLRCVGVLLTFHFICLCWVFFRAETYQHAFDMLRSIIFNFKPELALPFIISYKAVFSFIFLGLVLHFLPQKTDNFFEKLVIKSPLIIKSLLLIAVIWVVIQVKSADVQPFIYFQF